MIPMCILFYVVFGASFLFFLLVLYHHTDKPIAAPITISIIIIMITIPNVSIYIYCVVKFIFECRNKLIIIDRLFLTAKHVRDHNEFLICIPYKYSLPYNKYKICCL